MTVSTTNANSETVIAAEHDLKGISTVDASDHGKDAEAAVPQEKPTIAGFFHWHEPGTSKEEKKLIFKIDFFLLTFSCLMYFLKQLDQNNVANAYVSGMADQLGFGPGDELSWMNTYFLIGKS